MPATGKFLVAQKSAGFAQEIHFACGRARQKFPASARDDKRR